MSDLDSFLRDAARVGAAEYFPRVVDATSTIESRLIDENRFRGRVQSDELPEVSGLLSASLLLNDITVVNCLGGGPTSFQYGDFGQLQELIDKQELVFHVSPEELENADVDSVHPDLRACFAYPTGEVIDRFLQDAADVIADGRVVFQPSRFVMGRQRSSPADRNHVVMFQVDSQSPATRWSLASSMQHAPPTDVASDSHRSQGKDLFDVVLPIASDVPLRELNELLNAERDLLATFRAELKIAMRSATEGGSSTAEFVKDVINPRLETIQRRYKSLKRTHTAKTGIALVTSLALTYTAIDVASAYKTLVGILAGGGYASFGNQVLEYRSAMDGLKEEPLYLLWRCKQIASK